MTLTEKQAIWHGVHWSRWHWPDRSRENLSRTGKSLSHPLARGSTEATAILARCGTGYRVVTESGAFAV